MFSLFKRTAKPFRTTDSEGLERFFSLVNTLVIALMCKEKGALVHQVTIFYKSLPIAETDYTIERNSRRLHDADISTHLSIDASIGFRMAHR